MKRIWFFSKYSRTPVSGEFPARSFSLLRAMAAQGVDATLFMAGHDSFVKSLFKLYSAKPMIVDGVRVITISTLRFRRSNSTSRVIGWIQFELKLIISTLLQTEPPTVVVASSLSLLTVITGLFTRFIFRARLVFEVRDIWPLLLTETAGYSKKNPFIMFLGAVERLGYRRADYVIGTMPNLQEHVLSVINAHRNVYCIPMGVPDEMLTQSHCDIPKELDSVFPQVEFLVTHAGSVGIDNALETLIAAAFRLQDDPRFGFLIIGRGALLDRYRLRCKDLTSIVFIDSVPSHFVQGVLRRSSVLYFAAHPSKVLKYGQSLNKLVDYMVSGRPIIGSYSGFQSMVNESGCGEFVPAGDVNALVAILTEWVDRPRDELTAMGAQGRRWIIRHRRYEILAKKYLEIIDF